MTEYISRIKWTAPEEQRYRGKNPKHQLKDLSYVYYIFLIVRSIFVIVITIKCHTAAVFDMFIPVFVKFCIILLH